MFTTNHQPTLAMAYEWLDKAIRYEAEGKPTKFVDMALNRACQMELAALGCLEFRLAA